MCWYLGLGKGGSGCQIQFCSLNLDGSNVSRSRLPHLHSKGVRVESVNVNKGGASVLEDIWKCFGLLRCMSGGEERGDSKKYTNTWNSTRGEHQTQWSWSSKSAFPWNRATKNTACGPVLDRNFFTSAWCEKYKHWEQTEMFIAVWYCWGVHACHCGLISGMEMEYGDWVWRPNVLVQDRLGKTKKEANKNWSFAAGALMGKQRKITRKVKQHRNVS